MAAFSFDSQPIVSSVIDIAPPNTTDPSARHVVITGRNAPEKLVEFADLVTDMAGGRPGEARTTERQPGQPGGMAQGQGGEPNFLAIKQQVSQKVLDLTKKELEKKEGIEFDKCFVGEQIGSHIWALATLEVFKDQQVSPDLRSVIEKGIQTTQEHLDHAKKLADNLERQGGRETASRAGERRTE